MNGIDPYKDKYNRKDLMTIRQITDVAGCSINTVRNVGKIIFPNINSGGAGKTLYYTRDQAIQIMKKLPKTNYVPDPNLTNIDNPNLTNIDNPVDNSMGIKEMSIMIAQAVAAAMVPVMQQVTNTMMELKAPLQIEAPKEDYFSLLAYCSLHNIKTNRSELAMHGRELRKMALNLSLELKKIPDERWGEVNSYPVEILEEYFAI